MSATQNYSIPTQIEGSESVCGDLSEKAVFNNMIERLLFEHVEKVHAYRVERNLVSFHQNLSRKSRALGRE